MGLVMFVLGKDSCKIGYLIEVFQLFYELEFNDDEISLVKQDMKQ